jgi:hypothetical protein
MPLAVLLLPEVNRRLSRAHMHQYEHVRAAVQRHRTIREVVEEEELLNPLTDEQQTYARNYLDGIPEHVNTELISELRRGFEQELAIEVRWRDSEDGPMGARAAAAEDGKVMVTLSLPDDPDFPPPHAS